MYASKVKVINFIAIGMFLGWVTVLASATPLGVSALASGLVRRILLVVVVEEPGLGLLDDVGQALVDLVAG